MGRVLDNLPLLNEARNMTDFARTLQIDKSTNSMELGQELSLMYTVLKGLVYLTKPETFRDLQSSGRCVRSSEVRASRKRNMETDWHDHRSGDPNGNKGALSSPEPL